MEKSEMPSAHTGKCILQWNFDSSSRCSFDRLGFDDIYLLGVKHANRKCPICRLALTHFAGWYSILVSPWSFSKGHPTALLQGCLVFHGARPREAGKPQRERNEKRNKSIFQANDLILWPIAPNLYEFRSGSSCMKLRQTLRVKTHKPLGSRYGKKVNMSSVLHSKQASPFSQHMWLKLVHCQFDFRMLFSTQHPLFIARCC